MGACTCDLSQRHSRLRAHRLRAASSDRYRIELRPDDADASAVVLGSRLHEDEAREHAARLSEFLDWPIEATKGMAEGIVSGS